MTDTTDSPSAGWYLDPEDSSQYRYWEGDSWSEHRAPVYISEPRIVISDNIAGSGLAEQSFNVLRQLWVSYLIVAVSLFAASLVFWAGLWSSVDLILKGETDNILNRITSPGYDITSPAERAYFASLTFDWQISNFWPVAAATTFFWLTFIVGMALLIKASTRILKPEINRPQMLSKDTLKGVIRLIGVETQLSVIRLLLVAMLVLPCLLSWWTLLITIPVVVTLLLAVQTVAPIAYTVAVIGPSTWSIGYAARLICERFWGTAGIIWLIGLAISFANNSFTLLVPWIGASLGMAVSVAAISFYVTLYVQIQGEIVGDAQNSEDASYERQ